jgi:hypothetical protein
MKTSIIPLLKRMKSSDRNQEKGKDRKGRHEPKKLLGTLLRRVPLAFYDVRIVPFDLSC